MGKSVGICLLAVAWLAFAGEARANGYATDDAGRIYRVEPDEKKTELLGTVRATETKDGKTITTTPVLTDLANSDLHGLYGCSFTHLYKIDVRDLAKSVRVGALGGSFAQFNALAFDDDGRLFALEGNTLHQVNLETGKATPLGSLGGGFSSDGDLAWIGDALYASVNLGLRCHLVRIDPKTYAAKDVGAFRMARREGRKGTEPSSPVVTFDDVWGLIWDGRSLFALTPQGEVLEVDWKTAIVKPRYRTKVTYHGACPLIRI